MKVGTPQGVEQAIRDAAAALSSLPDERTDLELAAAVMWMVISTAYGLGGESHAGARKQWKHMRDTLDGLMKIDMVAAMRKGMH